VATKVTGPSGQMDWIRGGPPALDRAAIAAALDGSLRRLQTDYIDLYQLHWPDRRAPPATSCRLVRGAAPVCLHHHGVCSGNSAAAGQTFPRALALCAHAACMPRSSSGAAWLPARQARRRPPSSPPRRGAARRYVPMFGELHYDPARAYAAVGLEEQLEALGSAVAAGKVRAVGLSNETAWGLTTACHLGAPGLGVGVGSHGVLR